MTEKLIPFTIHLDFVQTLAREKMLYGDKPTQDRLKNAVDILSSIMIAGEYLNEAQVNAILSGDAYLSGYVLSGGDVGYDSTNARYHDEVDTKFKETLRFHRRTEVEFGSSRFKVDKDLIDQFVLEGCHTATLNGLLEQAGFPDALRDDVAKESKKEMDRFAEELMQYIAMNYDRKALQNMLTALTELTSSTESGKK